MAETSATSNVVDLTERTEGLEQDVVYIRRDIASIKKDVHQLVHVDMSNLGLAIEIQRELQRQVLEKLDEVLKKLDNR